MTKILGLDLSTNCGWAFWKPGMAQPRKGPIALPARVGDELERVFLALRLWLRDFDAMEPLRGGFVAIEAPIMTPKDDLRKLRLLIGLANEASTTALEFGAAPRDTKHDEMMKYWVGRSNFSREEKRRHGDDVGKQFSIKAAKARGWEPRDHNVADALGVLCHFAFVNKIEVPWDNGPCPSPQWLDLQLKGLVRAA